MSSYPMGLFPSRIILPALLPVDLAVLMVTEQWQPRVQPLWELL